MTLIIVLSANFAYGQNLQKTTLQVENLTCQSCLNNIEEQLKKTPGMFAISANLQNHTVTTEHSLKITAEQIASIISKLGYPAAVLGEQKIEQRNENSFANEPLSPCGTGGCGTKACGATASAWKELYHRFFPRHQP